MVEEKQINLFDLSKYGGKKLRGHYQKQEKKPEKLNPYAELSQLYSRVANYLPIPIMSTGGQEVFDYDLLTLWYSHYQAEKYHYQGESYDGEDFKIIQAELKGTEDLYVDEKIFIHKSLLNLIQKGTSINEAAKLLQPLIFKFKSGEIILEFDYGNGQV